MTIIFWDIPSTVGPWSPNTWKVRYCLGLKKIPYKTEWIEYPDVADHCKKLPMPCTSPIRFGSPYYSLPAIHDPSTGAYISDSTAIAEYLEKQYPEGPSIFPQNSIGLQIDFEDSLNRQLAALWDFVIPLIWKHLTPESQDYYRKIREKAWNKRLEDIPPIEEKYTEEWGKVKTGFAKMEIWYSKNEGPFIMGNIVSWADFVVGGHLVWMRIAWGEGDGKWKEVMEWDGGIWKTLLDALKKYETFY